MTENFPKKKSIEKREKVKTVFGGVFIFVTLLGCVAAGIVSTVIGVIKAEHYNRVYQNSITVTAIVTGYDSYDDDGDTDYKSYISYIVDGMEYTNIEYEDEDTQEQLTDVGEQVEVEVSPEDACVLISELKNDIRLLPLYLLICIGSLAALWGWILTPKYPKKVCGMPDLETIQRDVKLTIYGRMLPLFCFLLSVGYSLLRWRYLTVIKDWVLIVGAVSGIIWLWRICVSMRDIRRMNNNEYELRRDILIRKEHVSKFGDDTYTLYYQSGDKTWEKSVIEKCFAQATEGSAVWTVYLPGSKKPIAHYEMLGNHSCIV